EWEHLLDDEGRLSPHGPGLEGETPGRADAAANEAPVRKTLEHQVVQGRDQRAHVHGRPCPSRIPSTSRLKASSTPAPVLALVRTTTQPRASRVCTSFALTSQETTRSVLFNTTTNGRFPIASWARACREAAVSTVSRRVPSATSRYPAAPRRYES